MTHLFIVTALATLLFLGTHCGFAQQGQPHLTKPSGTESEDQGPPIKGGKFRIKTYFSLLEPIPGLKAAVSTESITALNKLSDDELMKRYKYFKELIEGERKNRILQPQPEEKVKEWKVELVRTFSSLQDHHIATPNEADETFAMALDSPSVADVVLANRRVSTTLRQVLAKFSEFFHLLGF